MDALCQNSWAVAFLAAEAVLLLTTVAVCLLLGRRHGGLAASAFFLLRGAALVIFALLFAQVFWGGREQKPMDSDTPTRKRRVVMLEDRSMSMTFRTPEGRTRMRLAADVWGQLQQRARGAEQGPVLCSRLLFADNLVTDADSERLRPHATRLVDAFAQALSGTAMDGLLVVSDGASTDGAVPRHMLNWARNRRVPVAAICCDIPQQSALDLAVLDVQCDTANPARVNATIARTGPQQTDARVTLEIDGRQTDTREMRLKDMQQVSFPVSDVPGGWHEYAVRVEPVPGETTELNNVRKGLFRTSSRRLLLLYDVPRAEDMHLARLLRKEFGDRILIASTRDKTTADLDAAGFFLVIVGDVAPARLPPGIRQALHRGLLTSILLPGRSFEKWTLADDPRLPILRHSGAIAPGGTASAEAEIRIEPAPGLRVFDQVQLNRLPLNLVHLVEPTMSGKTAVAAQLAELTFPLVLVDDFLSPSCLVSTMDTTWKWALHPEAETRKAYRDFWEAILGWVGADRTQTAPLRLVFPEQEHGSDSATVVVEPAQEGRLDELTDVLLNMAAGDRRTSVQLRRTGGTLQGRFPRPPERPVVVWFQATARCRSEMLASERMPLLIDIEPMELADTNSAPSTLQALVPDHPGRFAWYPDADRALVSLLEQLRPTRPEQHVRHRQAAVEIPLATIMFLMLAAAWGIERRLNARSEDSPPA